MAHMLPHKALSLSIVCSSQHEFDAPRAPLKPRLWSCIGIEKCIDVKDSNYSQKKAKIRTKTNIIMAYHLCQNEVKRKSRRRLF